MKFNKSAVLASLLLSISAIAAPVGSVPAGMPQKLSVGLFEDTGHTWMQNSGTAWNLKYRYFTYRWSDNWGFGPKDGSFAGEFFRDADAAGFMPAVAYYEMYDIPPANTGFGGKTKVASAMLEYFTNFKLLMQQAKSFGKPVLIMLEADGYAFLQGDSGGNPNTPAAVASTGMPELAGLPDTAAGWCLAFLQIRKAVGANNAILGIHISGWATGADLFHFSVTDPLQPAVDSVYNFLAPGGLAANVTGATYDVLIGDPLDRDADYYRLTRSEDRWWDISELASVSSKSMNRYAEWVRLWNLKSGKRWVLWQIPLGNAASPNNCTKGYKDNRTEYFFGANSQAHLQKFADYGVISLLFGEGADCQATQETDGDYIKNNAKAYLAGAGIPLNGSTPVADAGQPVVDAGLCICVCSCPPVIVDAGTIVVDAGVPAVDAGKPDSGSVVVDAGVKDAGTPVVDAGKPDAGTPVVDAGTPPTGSDNSTYNFEASVQGFKSDYADTSVSTSGTVVFAGSKSLSVKMSTTAAKTRQVYVPNPGAMAGKAVVFHVWVPAGSGLSSMQIYAQESAATSWRWTAFWLPVDNITLGGWTTASITIPANASSVQSLGVEFQFTAASTATIYIDAISVGGSVTPPNPVDAGTPTPVVDAGVTPAPVDAGVVPPITGQVRVMPLGDSLTAESHSWRCELSKLMTAGGIQNVFVGSQFDQYDSCAPNHEGHGGFNTADIAGSLVGWLKSARPDVITLMIGTNDLAWWTTDTGSIVADRTDGLITTIFQQLPNVRLVVATIPPESSAIIAPNNVNRQVLVNQYNTRLKTLVAARQAAGQKIRLADINAVITLADLRDGIHVEPAPGIAKMAPTFYTQVRALIP